ncbi:MAG TPA: cyclodeaminase/cyclohydrolase family protein [Planctomycetota bacterium]
MLTLRSMATPQGLIDRSLAEFVRAAAAPGPVPGSGSVAAALGALGAALGSMALGAARGEDHAPEAARTAARALGASAEALLAAVDEDARAYQGFLEARAGRGALPEALARSIAVPRTVAEGALAALERLSAGWAGIRPRLASEGLTAAQALLACVEGAAFTASANLEGLADAGARAAQAGELEALRGRARDLARAVSTRAAEVQA